MDLQTVLWLSVTLLALALGFIVHAWKIQRSDIVSLKDSIGEMSKASKAIAENRVKEAKEQALKNLNAADKDFEDDINSAFDDTVSR